MPVCCVCRQPGGTQVGSTACAVHPACLPCAHPAEAARSFPDCLNERKLAAHFEEFREHYESVPTETYKDKAVVYYGGDDSDDE